MVKKASNLKIDRTAFSVIKMDEQEEDLKHYWHSKTPHERLEAVELMRQLNYNYDPATDRVQRVLEVVERPLDSHYQPAGLE